MLNQTLEAHKKQKQQSKQLKSQIQEHQNTTLNHIMKLSLIIAIISYASGVVGHTLRGSQQHNEQNNEDITLYSSLWHDVPPHPVEYPGEDNIINFAVEIPLHIRAKMEMQKTIPGNPIQQDHFDDGSLRFYSYGNPFFNYGFVPQTWEDPELLDELGNGGDNDPLDVMEVGSQQLTMGSVVPSRVLGALTLIDEGQMDNKIIVLALSDPDADRIYNLDSR